MEEGDQNPEPRIQLLLQRVTKLVLSRKKQVEEELRACGRSRLARMVCRLPSLEPEQLEKIAMKDLPIASGALALAAASSCVVHATNRRLNDACRSADVALIMLGIPLGQPLLDFIILVEQDSLLDNSLFIEEGAVFAEDSDDDESIESSVMKDMNERCAEVVEKYFGVADFAKYFNNDEPVVIRKLASSWPSMQKWNDPTYLGNRYGHRTVPVEHTSSAGRMQEKFCSIAEVVNMMTRKKGSAIQDNVYMAQHPILDYIPDMRDGIRTPPYLTVVGKTKADLVNMWIGSSGTGTKLHFDSADNILVQLVGRKKIVLIDAGQSELLYQRNPTDNISPVDITKPDLEKFPRFAEVHGMTVYLEPGDAVYIPAQYWHWVRAISSSISVNFWF